MPSAFGGYAMNKYLACYELHKRQARANRYLAYKRVEQNAHRERAIFLVTTASLILGSLVMGYWI